MTITITIKASSVSSAIGCGFTTPNELIKEMLYPTKRKPLQNNPILKKAIEFKSQNSTDVQNKIKELTREIDNKGKLPLKPSYTPPKKEGSENLVSDDDESDDDVVELKKEVIKTLRTNHGTLHEATTASDCKRTLHTYEPMGVLNICKIGDVRFVVIGYVDRIETNKDGTQTLVEIKNRVNRLFYKVRDYENIQCQVYLQMFKDIQQCRLIEQYNKQINEMMIEKDNHAWNTSILPKLKQFCEELYPAYQKKIEENKHNDRLIEEYIASQKRV